jgi:prevent-host-death family protein
MLVKTINVHEAKAHLSELLERAHAGEEIILSRYGKPYARLVPLEKLEKVPLGFLQGEIEEAFFGPLPEEELQGWQ